MDPNDVNADSPSLPVPAIAIMLAVAVYRPLVLWAANPWSLSRPQDLLLFAVVVLGLESLVYVSLIDIGTGSAGAAVVTAATTFVLLNWHDLALLPPAAWLMIAFAAGRIGHQYVSDTGHRVVAVVSVAALTIAPAVQVFATHIQSADPYPILESPRRGAAAPSERVEDVLIVVVDSYPSLRLARDWFEHDTSRLESALHSRGFHIDETGWAQNTVTALSVPGLLDLRPVLEPGQIGDWNGNHRLNYRRIGGDNLVARSLQGAGFEYTHIESGWEGGRCGAQVDTCLEAHWLDEVTWNLLEPTIFRVLIESRYGTISVPGSKRSVSQVVGLRDKFDDGGNDLVFAHLLLPHAPIVVDESCSVLPIAARNSKDPALVTNEESRSNLAPQLACVDSLITQIIEVVGDRTAVLITGDHGPRTGLPAGGSPPAEWTDADLAEQFGVLLAYKAPDGCATRSPSSNIDAMRLLIECAVDIELPASHGRHLMGLRDPQWVQPSRMEEIKGRVKRGWILRGE